MLETLRQINPDHEWVLFSVPSFDGERYNLSIAGLRGVLLLNATPEELKNFVATY